MHAYAKHNEYADALGDLFDLTPKAVLAAVAVSALTHGGEHLSVARQRVLDEWRTLHANGIVPQRPVGRPREGKSGRGSRTPEFVNDADETGEAPHL